MRLKHILLCISIVLMLLSIIVLNISNITVVAQRIRREENLIIARLGAPTLSWNPFAPGGGHEWATWHVLYPPTAVQNTLTQDWVLFLIDRIEFNGDEITITIHIRPEARWSDGKPITADDLIVGYQLSRQVGAGWWGDWCVYNYEKIDDKTVKYYIARSPGEEPPPREEIILDWIGGPIGCVLFVRPLPAHVFQPIVEQLGEAMRTEWKNDDPAKQVVAGPYKLYYADATQVIYERIDDWWGKDIFGLPEPKYITFMYFKEATIAIQALVNGDVDAAIPMGGGYDVFVPNVEELVTKFGIKAWNPSKPYFIPGAIFWLYFNHNHPALKDVNVRKAIAWAIPWKDLVEYALQGLVKQAPVVGFVAEGVYKDYVNRDACQKYWGNPDCLLTQDLEKAKKILDDAGIVDRNRDGVRELPDGTPIKFTISVPAGAVLENSVASLIKESLEKIGMTVYVEALDYRVWWDNFRNSNFEATLCWSAGAYEVGHVRNSYGNALYSGWGNMARWMGYSNDRLNAIFEEMMRATIFPDQERDLAFAIQEILFEELPAIPLYYTPITWLYNTKYWDGWPNNQRPWWIPSWWGSLPVFFFIRRSGETIEKPWWYASIEDGGAIISMAKYNEYLRNCIYDAKSTTVLSGKPAVTPSPTPTPATTPATSPTPTPTPTETRTPTVIPGATVTITITTTAVSIITETVTKAIERIATITITIVERETSWIAVTIAVAIIILAVAIAITMLRVRQK